MTRKDLLTHLMKSKLLSQWHWFKWHFTLGSPTFADHPFAVAIVDALLDVDKFIPGFATRMADEIAAISGKEKHEPHFEQLLQRLAEVHVIRQIVSFPWSFPARFTWEPTPENGGKKNPELRVEGGPNPLLIEVKAPAILKHIRQRGTNPTQLPSRSIPKELWTNLPGSERGITLPRDNPVKDFLISANAKFTPFKSLDASIRTVLVILWDDFIYEPISALLSPANGLFTPASFAQDASGKALPFTGVDGVIVIRHLHQLIRATRDEPLIDSCRGPFDYGRIGEFPPKVCVANPNGLALSDEVMGCFQAEEPGPHLGAEYVPSDLIWWIDPK